jgi:hypothetical protein
VRPKCVPTVQNLWGIFIFIESFVTDLTNKAFHFIAHRSHTPSRQTTLQHQSSGRFAQRQEMEESEYVKVEVDNAHPIQVRE